jgi:hypothetical protein
LETKQLQGIFTYHPIKDGQAEKYKQIRLMALNMSLLINDLCPESREKSLSITKLQEAVMFANASIAIHE